MIYEFIKSREGLELKVYLDSVGKPTVGIGHLVLPEDKLKVGDVITEARAKEFFDIDIAKATAKATKQCEKLGISDDTIFKIFVSANFQLGDFEKVFNTTFSLLKDRKYAKAILNIAKSKWMEQSPVRAGDMIHAITKLVGNL